MSADLRKTEDSVNEDLGCTSIVAEPPEPRSAIDEISALADGKAAQHAGVSTVRPAGTLTIREGAETPFFN
jgi:hypothetical protein